MKALDKIREEARVIVEKLADRQIKEMESRNDEFKIWLNVKGNPILDSYSGEIVKYRSAQKFIFQDMNPGKEFTLKSSSEFFMFNKTADFRFSELYTMMRDNWKDRFRSDFVESNMFKLNRALAKHLTNDMTASDIKVNVGGCGAEVTANVDNKLFRTFGTLCGGFIQCLHYRYRSSLK